MTGKVLEWGAEETEDFVITPGQVADFESRGFWTTEFQGQTLAFREQPPEDGDIQIQPKLDAAGRVAASGGHTNYGYSGYYTAYVYLGGNRKRLVDWAFLFPEGENRYNAQQDKPRAEAAIRAVIADKSGTDVIRVPRGYAFDPEAHAARKAAS